MRVWLEVDDEVAAPWIARANALGVEVAALIAAALAGRVPGEADTQHSRVVMLVSLGLTDADIGGMMRLPNNVDARERNRAGLPANNRYGPRAGRRRADANPD